jgi:cytochrome P450
MLVESGNPFGFLRTLNLSRQLDLARNEKVIHGFFDARIQERLEAGAAEGRFVIDPVVEALRSPDERGTLTEAEYRRGMIQNLKIIIFAGSDTTSTTICRAYFLLERNPACLARLRAEHDAVFGTDPDAAAGMLKAQPALINAVPYTTAVLKETLRLYPPGLTIREGQQGFYLRRDGFPPFPTEGFILWDGHQGVHRNAEFWPRPSEFLPERYLATEDDPLYVPKNYWRGFSHPPRSCIGQDLAMLEMKLTLVLVSRQVEIKTAWDEWDR